MPQRNFYIIYIKPNDSMASSKIKRAMDRAISWYNTGPMWVVFTKSDSDTWYARLKDLVMDDGSLFICKLDINESQGWMGKEFWEWIRKWQSQM